MHTRSDPGCGPHRMVTHVRLDQFAAPPMLQPSRFHLASSNARQRYQPLLSRLEDTLTSKYSVGVAPPFTYLRAQLTRISRGCEQNRRVFSNRPQIDPADRAGGPRKPGQFRHDLADYAVSQQEWDRFPKTVTCRRLSDISSAHLQEPHLPHRDEPTWVRLSCSQRRPSRVRESTIGDGERGSVVRVTVTWPNPDTRCPNPHPVYVGGGRIC